MLPPSSIIVGLLLWGGHCLTLDLLVLACPPASALEVMETLVPQPLGLVASLVPLVLLVRSMKRLEVW
jgi:hypothetical protein